MVPEVRVAATVREALPAREAAALAERVLRAEGARDAALSVTFVGRRRIRTLNRAWLGHDRVTDVIAFNLQGAPAHSRTAARSGPPVRPSARPPVVGDIYICPEVAAASARRHGVSRREELRRLVIHGVLHVLGYDHPRGADRAGSPMWRRQERHLARFGARR